MSWGNSGESMLESAAASHVHEHPLSIQWLDLGPWFWGLDWNLYQNSFQNMSVTELRANGLKFRIKMNRMNFLPWCLPYMCHESEEDEGWGAFKAMYQTSGLDAVQVHAKTYIEHCKWWCWWCRHTYLKMRFASGCWRRNRSSKTRACRRCWIGKRAWAFHRAWHDTRRRFPPRPARGWAWRAPRRDCNPPRWLSPELAAGTDCAGSDKSPPARGTSETIDSSRRCHRRWSADAGSCRMGSVSYCWHGESVSICRTFSDRWLSPDRTWPPTWWGRDTTWACWTCKIPSSTLAPSLSSCPSCCCCGGRPFHEPPPPAAETSTMSRSHSPAPALVPTVIYGLGR